MSKNSLFFEFGPAVIHYTIFGNGPKVLLAFHGYGQTNEDLRVLEKHLSKDFRVFAFDLFYHGQSFWKEENTKLNQEFWKALLNKFLMENNVEKFSLLGFSMGGKLVLATIASFAQHIEEVTLIAPDGIKTSFWYSLATYPGFFRKVFRSVIVRPKIYYKTVKVMEKFKIIDKGILRFANTQMRSREQRRRVYYSWVIFRDLNFDLEKIAFLLNLSSTKITFFLGQYDKIITHKNLNRFIKKLSKVEVKILEAGHSNLIPAVAKHFSNPDKNQ